MPIYEFRCINCGQLYEKLFKTMDEELRVECPRCKSESFERVISRTNYVLRAGKGKKPEVASKSCSAGSECMTFEIPGPDD